MNPEYAESTFDETGHERRRAVFGYAECPECGKEVELITETEEWVEGTGAETGKWVHKSYGPGQGVCCRSLVVDSWDGCSAYDLSGGEPD